MKSEFSFSGFFLTCIVLCGVLILTGLSYTPLGAIAAGGIQAAETTAAHHFEMNSRPATSDEITIDWNNVAALEGQELYNDGQSVVTIVSVEAIEGGNYNLHIEAVGEIASGGGHLVTPLSHDGSLPEGKIMAVVGDSTTFSPVVERGQAALHAGDTAVIPVFPGEVPAEEIAANGGQVSITLLHLNEISYLKH
ncbi:MAG: hypothetical protein IJ936_02355 [Peptococcaceae bacterium]|nr:hypothetical protein [Peptococcaceae bacterium]